MLNVVTFSANLCNQLTNKIIEKFSQSKTDFFIKISNKYRQNISYLEMNNKKLISNDIPRYADGSIKEPTNYIDLLATEDKEEFLTLLNLEETYKSQIRELRLYLLTLANKTQQVNEQFEIISYEVISYLKFFKCLPDFIMNDKELLTSEINYVGRLSEEDLYEINNYLDSLTNSERIKTEQEIEEFAKINKNEKIESILATFYSLEFLVDF